MSEHSWDIDYLVDKDAAKLFECLFCLGILRVTNSNRIAQES